MSAECLVDGSVLIDDCWINAFNLPRSNRITSASYVFGCVVIDRRCWWGIFPAAVSVERALQIITTNSITGTFIVEPQE